MSDMGVQRTEDTAAQAAEIRDRLAALTDDQVLRLRDQVDDL